jgi:hypothetical protein
MKKGHVLYADCIYKILPFSRPNGFRRRILFRAHSRKSLIFNVDLRKSLIFMLFSDISIWGFTPNR